MVVIHKNRMVDTWNPPPQNETERKWLRQHKTDLQTAAEQNICPACKRELGENDIVFDLGYLYGIECEHCR